jgi:hypothetical protein
MKASKMVHKEPSAADESFQPVSGNHSEETAKWFVSDLQFHRLYPESLHTQANMHWTPLSVARKAAEFLAVDNGAKILDIGSGAGKFCLTAAYHQPQSFFYGIEQRAELVNAALAAEDRLRLNNVSFVHGNLIEVDLSQYDHFYFFNAFYENLDDGFKIDDTLHYSRELYQTYNSYLYKQLEKKPSGTRLATFHSLEDEISEGYHEVSSSADNLLKCWIKI